MIDVAETGLQGEEKRYAEFIRESARKISKLLTNQKEAVMSAMQVTGMSKQQVRNVLRCEAPAQLKHLDELERLRVFPDGATETLRAVRQYMRFIKKARYFNTTNALNFLRFWHDITIPELSEKSGISVPTLYRMTKTQELTPMLTTKLQALAEAFGTDVDGMLELQRKLTKKEIDGRGMPYRPPSPVPGLGISIPSGYTMRRQRKEVKSVERAR